MSLYDAALDYMDQHPETIADDTDDAASSLNLIDSLVKAAQKQAAASAARRASRMPAKRPEQYVQIAFWLSQTGDPRSAYAFFQRGKGAAGDGIWYLIKWVFRVGDPCYCQQMTMYLLPSWASDVDHCN